jgi:hypothetical protein
MLAFIQTYKIFKYILAKGNESQNRVLYTIKKNLIHDLIQVKKKFVKMLAA